MKYFGLITNVLLVLAVLITITAQPVNAGNSDSHIGIRPASQDEISALGLRTTGALVVISVLSTGDHGLVAGDVIVFVNGNLVKTLKDLVSIAKTSPNSPLEILLYRNKLPKTVKSTLHADTLKPAKANSSPKEEEAEITKPVDFPGVDTSIETREPSEELTGKDTSTDKLEYPEDLPPELKSRFEEVVRGGEGDEFVVIGSEKTSAEDDKEIQALIQQLKNTDSTERIQAAMELAEFGSAASIAFPALIKALQDSESSVRMAAAVGIGGVGFVEESSKVVPALIKALNQDSSALVRVELIQALSQHAAAGPQVLQAIEAFQKSLRDRDPRVRKAAEEALDLFGMGPSD